MRPSVPPSWERRGTHATVAVRPLLTTAAESAGELCTQPIRSSVTVEQCKDLWQHGPRRSKARPPKPPLFGTPRRSQLRRRGGYPIGAQAHGGPTHAPRRVGQLEEDRRGTPASPLASSTGNRRSTAYPSPPVFGTAVVLGFGVLCRGAVRLSLSGLRLAVPDAPTKAAGSVPCGGRRGWCGTNAEHHRRAITASQPHVCVESSGTAQPRAGPATDRAGTDSDAAERDCRPAPSPGRPTPATSESPNRQGSCRGRRCVRREASSHRPGREQPRPAVRRAVSWWHLLWWMSWPRF